MCLKFGDFDSRMKAKKRFLFYRIEVALRVLRPKDIAKITIIKNNSKLFVVFFAVLL